MTTQARPSPRHTDRPDGYGRSAPSWVLIAFGYACIVAGGLVAAVTGPLDLQHGSWTAAYLVLVGGIAQLALGWVPDKVGRPTPGRAGWILVVAWNLGNALVIAGTLTGQPVGVDLGSVLLVLALVVAIVGLLRRADLHAGGWSRVLRVAYLCLLVVLAVSIPVGILLSYLRH